MYRTHARPTTAGVVSTAVMVLRAARLVIAIAPRALNWVEERGWSRGCANRQQRRGDFGSATDFDKRAHAKTQRVLVAGRAPRRAGAALRWRACERNGLALRRFSLLRSPKVRSLLCGAALRLPAPRTPPPRRSDAPTGRAATRPTTRADKPLRRLCFPYFLVIRTFPPTSFKAGRPCISELLANVALHVGQLHSASASAPSRLASRPAESSDILSM